MGGEQSRQGQEHRGGGEGVRDELVVARRPRRRKTSLSEKKDELDDALGDLNRSTNRLRRKFDPTDKWMETRPQVENVLDDARKINQVMVRGKYGTQAERYWAVLREKHQRSGARLQPDAAGSVIHEDLGLSVF